MGTTMGKKANLKEKKKELREKENEVLFELTVTIMGNNDVQVHGPIEDPLLIMRMLAGAMNTIVDHNISTAKLNADIEKNRKENEASRIVDIKGNNITPESDTKKIIIQ